MKISKDKLREVILAKKAELQADIEVAERKQVANDAAFTAAVVKWAKKVAALKAPTREKIEAFSMPYKAGKYDERFAVSYPYYHDGNYYHSANIEQCDADLAMLDLIDGDSVTISTSRYGQWRNYLP